MDEQQRADYRIRIHPQAHEIEVRLELSNAGANGPLRVQTPTWVPGAYGFMKYGRDLFEVRARDGRTGQALRVERDGWAGFRVDGATGPIVLEHKAYAYDPAWGELAGLVGHDQAVLLGTRYLYAPALRGPCRVHYELPSGWQLHHPSGARRLPDGAFEYPSHAALLDTPVVAGRFERLTRTSHGVPFHFVFLDRTFGFEGEAEPFVDALMSLASACHGVFGGYPFEDYTFLFTFNPQAKWGLEHATSTMIALEPDCLIDPAARARGLRVCAHELFHAWNVCRLKPAPLGAPDLDRGSFPDALWVSEGFTRYYEFLLMARAGLLTPHELLSNLVNYHRQLASHPASRRVSLLDSSKATFLNHNKYPGSVNASVDYYDAGMLAAFDLDVALRAGEPASTLDDELRAFYAAFAGRGAGFTHTDARDFFARGRPAVADLLAREVESPGPIDVPASLARLGFEAREEQVPRLGLVMDADAPAKIANVTDDGAAAESGVAPGDEVVLVDGFAFGAKGLRWAVAHQREVRLTVRRGAEQLIFACQPRVARQVGALVWRGGARELERVRRWLGKPDLELRDGESVPLTAYENFHGVQTVI